MRKTSIITILVLLVLGVGGWVVLNNPLSPERAYVEDVSTKFMEDLQFKDFRSSSLYHHELERDRVDVGRTLEKLFLVKPEFLDIMEYRVAKAEVDSSGDRARVLINAKFRRLNMKDEPEEGEIVLYWIKRHPDCPLGSECPSGRCVNEVGEVLYEPVPDATEQAPRTKEEVERSEDEDDPKQPFTCDPAAEPQWFMNLDSTLKEKRYNY